MNPQQPHVRTAWSRFPYWMLLAMGLVMAVNARFVTLAITTFPGAASLDDFDTSNQYNTIMSRVDQQNALGWKVRAEAGEAAAPAILIAGPDGRPLGGATVQAVARRPLGDDPDTNVALTEVAPGRYVVAVPLRQGQWDLLLHVSAGGHNMRVTRRVLFR